MHVNDLPTCFSRLSDTSESPAVVAHRGASRAAHENSLAAVERAIHFGAEVVEIDVRRTGDGVLIAHHDPTVEGEAIAALTYDDLAATEGHAPATIDAIACLAAGRTLLDVELKEAGYEEDVLAALHRHVQPHDYIITSFLEPAVAAARQAGARAGLLSRPHTSPEELFAAAERCGADLVAPHHTRVDEPLLQGAVERGLPVLIWTVNEPDELERWLHDPRIGGVITDLPDRAVALRAELGLEGDREAAVA